MKKLFVLLPILMIATACNSQTSLSSQTQQSQTSVQTNVQPSGPTDFGTDVKAFTQAAQSCMPSKVTMNAEFPIPFGIATTLYTTEQVQILGYEGKYCHFFSTRTDVITKLHKEILDQGIQAGVLTQTQENQYIAKFNAQSNPDPQTKANNIGLTTDCTFTIPNLLTLLNQWQNPNLTGDVHVDVTLTPTSGKSNEQGIYKYCKITLPTK